ncbi:hypothetical protein P7K49_004535 [Saguinus oedipus]|uniref:Uncharacterized protein n=1 Tax=Saguinus oedipus TaxID=9490 RepID=A0ABQ9W7Q0_SAGOE|nr:hypothetical protein P7K49_004535 [Saguinus oedipus]
MKADRGNWDKQHEQIHTNLSTIVGNLLKIYAVVTKKHKGRSAGLKAGKFGFYSRLVLAFFSASPVPGNTDHDRAEWRSCQGRTSIEKGYTFLKAWEIEANHPEVRGEETACRKAHGHGTGQWMIKAIPPSESYTFSGIWLDLPCGEKMNKKQSIMELDDAGVGEGQEVFGKVKSIYSVYMPLYSSIFSFLHWKHPLPLLLGLQALLCMSEEAIGAETY